MKAEIFEARYQRSAVVQEVAFDVPSDRPLLLVGGNASGKTTCLRALVGLVPVVRGTLTIGTRTLGLEDGRRLRATVAFMPQSEPVFDSLTVDQHLDLGSRLLPDDQRQRAVSWLKQRLPFLEVARSRKGRQLSVGQRQLVGAALALSSRRPLLLFDEPLAGLDATTATSLVDVFTAVGNEFGARIVMAEHRIALLGGLDASVVGLRAGRVVFRGSATDLRDAKVLDEIYGFSGVS